MNTNWQALVREELAQLKTAVDASGNSIDVIASMGEAILATLAKGGKILSAGNGGSAADAMHIAEELVSRFKSNRCSLPALALVADCTVLTCIGNDFGFDYVFSRQIESLGKPGDLLSVFSTSGNSKNLVLALQAAKKNQMTTLSFLGKDGGAMKGLADIEWIVPSPITARIQELHTWALHVLMEIVECTYVNKKSI